MRCMQWTMQLFNFFISSSAGCLGICALCNQVQYVAVGCFTCCNMYVKAAMQHMLYFKQLDGWAGPVTAGRHDWR
jgi:hypothetical protein